MNWLEPLPFPDLRNEARLYGRQVQLRLEVTLESLGGGAQPEEGELLQDP